MRIEILKNKETSLVIDDIGRSIYEDGILQDGYKKAIQALKRYIKQTKRSRQQLSKARGSESQINDILYQSPHNIIAFTGGRGTGKTSAMISFTEFLKSRGEGSTESRSEESIRLWAEEGLSELYTLVLSPIDPTMLENDQDILSVVLSRLLYKAEERWNMNPDFHRRNQNLEKDKNDLLKKANACLNGILSIKRKGEIKSLSDLQRMGDSAILKKNLFDLVDIVNRFCIGNDHIRAESSYLVIPIDDTDCQIQKAHNVMEDIRRYLTIPNVLILMATDGDMLRNDFAQHYAAEFKTGIDRAILEPIDVEHYAEKYLTKLIPGTHRIYLPVFENILQGNTVRLELGYYDNEDRDRNLDLISGSTRALRDQNRGNKKEIDFDFQSKILTFIYQKTGIVFFEHTAYINNIIPTTMRGLAHLLNFLDSMEKVVKIDYAHDYTAQEIRQILRKRLLSLEKNLDLFEEYFMNEWVPAKVSGDMVRILKGIEEQVPANLVKYAYDEMYDRYISKDAKGDPFYGRNTNAPYHELMEMLGLINDTIHSFNIPKTFKHRLDFYNTFAVRTLLTIKNSKQVLKARLGRIDTIKTDGVDDQQWEIDFRDYQPGNSLPQNITGMNDREYKAKLMPVVHLYCELLKSEVKQEKELSSAELFSSVTGVEDKSLSPGASSTEALRDASLSGRRPSLAELKNNRIEIRKKQSSMEKFCMQELIWVVLSNWDVQDIIYKTVTAYLEQGKKNPEELWKEINKAIAERNCGMLSPIIEKGKAEIITLPEYFSDILAEKDAKEQTQGHAGNAGELVASVVAPSGAPEFVRENLGSSLLEKIENIERRLSSDINNGLISNELKDLNADLTEKLIKMKEFDKTEFLAKNMQKNDKDELKRLIRGLQSKIRSGDTILETLNREQDFASERGMDEGFIEEAIVISGKTKSSLKRWLTYLKRWIADANKLYAVYNDFL